MMAHLGSALDPLQEHGDGYLSHLRSSLINRREGDQGVSGHVRVVVADDGHVSTSTIRDTRECSEGDVVMPSEDRGRRVVLS